MNRSQPSYPSPRGYSSGDLPANMQDAPCNPAGGVNYPQDQWLLQQPTPSSLTSTPQPAQTPFGNPRKPVRAGIREKRYDNQPKVYHEIPSFPSFDEPVPDSASLEEICARYPNHLRGKYLDAFIQWYWTANDIFSRLHPLAIQEFKQYGIATCSTHNNRANFLFKRLDTYLKNMTADEVKQLCLAPKIRKCLADGTERYGGSKLQGKFNNPYAQEVRRFPRRRDNRTASGTAAGRPAFLAPKPQEFPVWESIEAFNTYKTAMAQYWSQQWQCADLIIDADAHLSNIGPTERNALILQIAQLPASHTLQTLFQYHSAEACPAFLQLIDSKVKAIFNDMVSTNLHSVTADLLSLNRQYAVSIVLSQQEAICAKLRELTAGLDNVLQNGQKIVGLVHQAIKANAGLAGSDVPATTTSLKRSIGEVETEDMFPKRVKLENSDMQYHNQVLPSGGLVEMCEPNDFDKELDECNALMQQENAQLLISQCTNSSENVVQWLQGVSSTISPPPSQIPPPECSSSNGNSNNMVFDNEHIQKAESTDSGWPPEILDEVETAQSSIHGAGDPDVQMSNQYLPAPVQLQNQQTGSGMYYSLDVLQNPGSVVLSTDPDWLKQMLEEKL
ncbi:hypothetical protein A1O1_07886 [Capronia coronata CBS 617.96]|uniref:Uncharacterized protein n=1 Tax=Capronia coronata CBS 617.96 TaxID=1182541 RepID=W9XXW1_9EURO|nr:uncharacterized protein A1O1_07886 [Capronia coronata CBS 617.96]EXJ81821.1 hypothetical protein A1O1_07886 [Capronia coronata CBS 617.96]